MGRSHPRTEERAARTRDTLGIRSGGCYLGIDPSRLCRLRAVGWRKSCSMDSLWRSQVYNQRGLPQHFWWMVVLEAAIAVATGLLMRLVDFCDTLLGDRYTHHVSIQVCDRQRSLT